MKNVLWISRHNMTMEQYEDLVESVGDECMITIVDRTLQSIGEIESMISKYDIFAAVLPIHLLADLVKAAEQKPVFVSVSGRKKKEQEKSDNNETAYEFSHLYWERIKRLELETEIYRNK